MSNENIEINDRLCDKNKKIQRSVWIYPLKNRDWSRDEGNCNLVGCVTPKNCIKGREKVQEEYKIKVLEKKISGSINYVDGRKTKVNTWAYYARGNKNSLTHNRGFATQNTRNYTNPNINNYITEGLVKNSCKCINPAFLTDNSKRQECQSYTPQILKPPNTLPFSIIKNPNSKCSNLNTSVPTTPSVPSIPLAPSFLSNLSNLSNNRFNAANLSRLSFGVEEKKNIHQSNEPNLSDNNESIPTIQFDPLNPSLPSNLNEVEDIIDEFDISLADYYLSKV